MQDRPPRLPEYGTARDNPKKSYGETQAYSDLAINTSKARLQKYVFTAV
jgi:hypothetical protein